MFPAWPPRLLACHPWIMAPFEVVIFHCLPGDHRAWCTAETAVELERFGLAKRPDSERDDRPAMRFARGGPKTAPHPGRGQD
jgi:hypothetical protein